MSQWRKMGQYSSKYMAADALKRLKKRGRVGRLTFKKEVSFGMPWNVWTLWDTGKAGGKV